MSLPTDAAARKAIPVYSGFVVYFPDAIAAVAQLSQIANEQHNPGTDVHWDRSKSKDELDAMMRHTLDMAGGTESDADGVLHATKQAWRSMANLQKLLESKKVAEVKSKWVLDLLPGGPTCSYKTICKYTENEVRLLFAGQFTAIHRI